MDCSLNTIHWILFSQCGTPSSTVITEVRGCNEWSKVAACNEVVAVSSFLSFSPEERLMSFDCIIRCTQKLRELLERFSQGSLLARQKAAL